MHFSNSSLHCTDYFFFGYLHYLPNPASLANLPNMWGADDALKQKLKNLLHAHYSWRISVDPKLISVWGRTGHTPVPDPMDLCVPGRRVPGGPELG